MGVTTKEASTNPAINPQIKLFILLGPVNNFCLDKVYV